MQLICISKSSFKKDALGLLKNESAGLFGNISRPRKLSWTVPFFTLKERANLENFVFIDFSVWLRLTWFENFMRYAEVVIIVKLEIYLVDSKVKHKILVSFQYCLENQKSSFRVFVSENRIKTVLWFWGSVRLKRIQ